MAAKRSRILVAVDGSEQAFEAVRYVSKLLPPDRMEVVLFNVMSRIPESFLDLKDVPQFRQQVASVSAWQLQQEKMMRDFMDKAQKILVDAGVPESAVVTEIHERKVGVARDIALESQKGYEAVVLGRKGLSAIADLVMGSVANKLVGRLVDVPVWVIGGVPPADKVLVSVDASEGAMRAVEYTGKMLGGTDAQVSLVHVVRAIGVFQFGADKFSITDQQKKWLEKAGDELERITSEMEFVLNDMRKRLVDAGVKAERITTRIITDVTTRAGAIVEEAKSGNCGTIVVGRRGLSRVEEFFMGRVSNKVVQMAKEFAVWVVS